MQTEKLCTKTATEITNDRNSGGIVDAGSR